MIIMTWKSTYCDGSMCIVHSTLYTVHCTLFSGHCTLYILWWVHVHCTQCSVHCTVYNCCASCWLDYCVKQLSSYFIVIHWMEAKFKTKKYKAFLKCHSLKIKFYSKLYLPFLIQTRWIPENIYFYKLIAFICLKDQTYFDCMLALSP